jgi:predicted outer membrane repeat protein
MRQRFSLLMVAMLLVVPGLVHAGGTVTACLNDTQAGAGLNLRDALATGGTVTFACKPGQTIDVTQHVVSGTTLVDGGGAVTLRAISLAAMFIVPGDLTLRGLTLNYDIKILGAGIPAPGPAGIASGAGRLTLIDSTISNSNVSLSVETTTVRHSQFQNNSGVLIAASHVVIEDSDFVNNPGATALHNILDGSALPNVALVDNSRFRNNGTAIEWSGRLTVRNSEFQNNAGGNRPGGAIRLTGDGVVDHTTFDGNSAVEGGGIWLDGGTLSLERAVMRNNTAVKDGGAIGIGELAEGSIISRYSTFAGNKAGRGGAIKLAWSGAQIALQGGPNSFAQNSATEGGAIYSDLGRIQLQRGVFVGNSATSEGGAIFGARRGPDWAVVLANSLVVRNSAPAGSAISGGTITLINSSVADNKGPAIASQPLSHFATPGARPGLEFNNALIANNQGGNCGKPPVGLTLVENGHNLQFPDAQCGGLAVGDPGLDPLYVPAPGSPAYNGGDNLVCASAPISSRDVYGATRSQGHACAIGAVEGDIDPRLFRKLLWWLNDRIRGNLGVKLSPK